MSLLCRLSGLSFRDTGEKFSNSGRTQRRVAAPSHGEELIVADHLVRMTPGHLLGQVCWECPIRRRSRGRPRAHWRDDIYRLTWEHLGVLKEEMKEVAEERGMEDWMDEWMDGPSHIGNTYCGQKNQNYESTWVQIVAKETKVKGNLRTTTFFFDFHLPLCPSIF